MILHTYHNKREVFSYSGLVSASGDTELVAAQANKKIKVIAYCVTMNSTTSVLYKFTSAAGGTELWRLVLQAPTGVGVGANLAVDFPAQLFETVAGQNLTVNLGAAINSHISVTYHIEG